MHFEDCLFDCFYYFWQFFYYFTFCLIKNGTRSFFLIPMSKYLLGLMYYWSKINKEIYIDMEIVFFPWIGLHESMWKLCLVYCRNCFYRSSWQNQKCTEQLQQNNIKYLKGQTQGQGKGNHISYFKTHMLPTVQWVKWLQVCCWLH